jgi:hypothetical protein
VDDQRSGDTLVGERGCLLDYEGLAFGCLTGPFSAIDVETKILETRQKALMKSAAPIFDGSSDGMQISSRRILFWKQIDIVPIDDRVGVNR